MFYAYYIKLKNEFDPNNANSDHIENKKISKNLENY